jgi:hypothetical protein
MNNLEIIKKHLSPQIELEISNGEGKDILLVNPINNTQRILIYSLLGRLNEVSELSKKKDNEGKIIPIPIEKMVEYEKKTSSEMIDLYKSVLGDSLEGDLSDTELENFILSHFKELRNQISKLLPKSAKQEDLDEIKQKLRGKNK